MEDSKSTNSNNSHAHKLSAEIQKTWNKLTTDEVALNATNPTKFYDAVKTKYSIDRVEAEKTVKKLDADCAAACAANANKDGASKDASIRQPAGANQAPTAKAS